MADNDDSLDPVAGERVVPAEAPTPAAPIMKPRWRDRAWDFRSMIAVAAASLLVGGIVGGAIGAAANGDDDHGRMQRFGPGAGMPPGWHRQGPRWHWNEGPNNGPGGPGGPLTPYGTGGGTAPQPPSASPSPGTAG
jgi:hypothetical protein